MLFGYVISLLFSRMSKHNGHATCTASCEIYYMFIVQHEEHRRATFKANNLISFGAKLSQIFAVIVFNQIDLGQVVFHVCCVCCTVLSHPQ